MARFCSRILCLMFLSLITLSRIWEIRMITVCFEIKGYTFYNVFIFLICSAILGPLPFHMNLEIVLSLELNLKDILTMLSYPIHEHLFLFIWVFLNFFNFFVYICVYGMYVYICLFTCVGIHMHMCVHRAELDIRCILGPLSVLLSEAGSLSQSRAL